MIRALVALILWLPLTIAACCHPTRVDHAVVVRPPPCLTEPAPRPPTSEDDAAWAAYHVRLEAWAALAERSCLAPIGPPPIGPIQSPRSNAPDPGPKWWARQPSGAAHGD